MLCGGAGQVPRERSKSLLSPSPITHQTCQKLGSDPSQNRCIFSRRPKQSSWDEKATARDEHSRLVYRLQKPPVCRCARGRKSRVSFCKVSCLHCGCGGDQARVTPVHTRLAFGRSIYKSVYDKWGVGRAAPVIARRRESVWTEPSRDDHSCAAPAPQWVR